jgi:hypothetical protein
MIRPQAHQNSRKKIGKTPCEDLFIYYLKGRLKFSDQIFQNNFIGNWEEEDDSILFFSTSADQQIENLLHRLPHLEYVDSYRMPYNQWLGEKFTICEHGAFRIMPPWEVTEDRVNSLEDRIVIVQGRAEEMIAYPADLLIANIHFDVMHNLIRSKEFLAKRRFILSGLLRSEAKHIAEALQRYPVKILKHWTQDGIWHTIYGKTE